MVRRAQNLGDAALSGCFSCCFRSWEGSWKPTQGLPACLWELKSQRQRLGPERPEGRSTVFLFFFEQMAQPPDACLSGCLSIITGNHSCPSQGHLCEVCSPSGALTTSQVLGGLHQGPQTPKGFTNKIQELFLRRANLHRSRSPCFY